MYSKKWYRAELKRMMHHLPELTGENRARAHRTILSMLSNLYGVTDGLSYTSKNRAMDCVIESLVNLIAVVGRDQELDNIVITILNKQIELSEK